MQAIISLRMFVDDPEFCLDEEHSRELMEEYYLIYQYQIPIQFTPNCQITDINTNFSENPTDACSSYQEDSLDNSPNFATSPRDLIFIPVKNKNRNNIGNYDNSDIDNDNNDNDNKNGNITTKNETVNKIKKDIMKSNKKNVFMPVKSAIFILKNNNLILENIFFEMRRCEEILNRRLRLRRKLRNSLETVNLSDIRQNVKNTEILHKFEVTIKVSKRIFIYRKVIQNFFAQKFFIFYFYFNELFHFNRKIFVTIQ